MFLIKSLAGALGTAFIAWSLVLAVMLWRMGRLARNLEPGKLRAVALEPSYLLTTPWAVAIVTIGFGFGLWLTSNYLARKQTIP
jgi:hypothetical protein